MIEPTVFVVDDDASIRDALGLLISLKGLRACVFSSAQEFLVEYDLQWRGCLLTDLQMPGMSGLDLQATLQERGSVLPVVVLTAHGDVATTRAALKSGAVDFLEKPVDDAVLIDVLRNAIRIDAERHRAHTQRAETMTRLARLTPRERDAGVARRRFAAQEDRGAARDQSPHCGGLQGAHDGKASVPHVG